jgi:succinate-semialdehyde dehydrogenase/glutarate-semialdehyde dehydrogenase
MDETGKVYSGAAYDFDMLFSCLDFFAGAAKGLHGEIIEDGGDEMLNLIIRKPVGVVVGYLAWNFPLLNVAYKIGPVLASGCTAVIKPSSKTPLATLMLGEILESINFPRGVINFVAGSSSEIGPVLSGSSLTSLITMIGSTAGGLQVIKDSATSIKHFSLELGGNAPVIVMDDADLELAAMETANLKFSNCGQICVAPNRVYAPAAKYEEFLEQLKEKTESLSLGWAREEGAYVAPLINRDDRDKMQELIDDAISKGAKILTGGKIPSDKPQGGNWFSPCVLYNVTPQMRVYKEEIFGPVLPVIKFEEGDDVAALGNDTEYGLAAYLFTSGLDNALKVSRELDFGSVCINKAFYSVELPHGGLKQSGVGKDCSTYSLEEYYSIQRISIAR